MVNIFPKLCKDLAGISEIEIKKIMPSNPKLHKILQSNINEIELTTVSVNELYKLISKLIKKLLLFSKN